MNNRTIRTNMELRRIISKVDKKIFTVALDTFGRATIIVRIQCSETGKDYRIKSVETERKILKKINKYIKSRKSFDERINDGVDDLLVNHPILSYTGLSIIATLLSIVPA